MCPHDDSSIMYRITQVKMWKMFTIVARSWYCVCIPEKGNNENYIKKLILVASLQFFRHEVYFMTLFLTLDKRLTKLHLLHCDLTTQ